MGTPSSHIQSFPNVYKSDESIPLLCSKCGGIVMSSWFLRRGDVVAVLRPTHGHTGCESSTLFPTDRSIKSCSDRSSSVDICPHGRERAACKECGGRRICEHNKRRDSCQICKVALGGEQTKHA